MSKTWQTLGRTTQLFIQLLLVLFFIGAVFYLFPRVSRFKYDYEKGKPWVYEDLISPYNFTLLKSEEEIDKERKSIEDNHLPHYSLDETVIEQVKEEYFSFLSKQYQESSDSTIFNLDKLLIEGSQFIDSIYRKGVVVETSSETMDIVVVDDGVAKKISTTDLYNLTSIKEQLTNLLKNKKSYKYSALLQSIDPNIIENFKINEDILESKYAKISTTDGLVQEGEKIVENGDIVDVKTYQKLVSLEQSYNSKLLAISQVRILSIGYLLAISIAIAVLMLYLYYYRRPIFSNLRHFIFILLLIIGFLALTSIVIKKSLFFLYAIPFCIVPIVLRAFFGRELALYTHLVIILIAGLFVPQPFQFVFIQLICGIIAIYGNKNVRYWSQFFKAIGFIFIAYVLCYTAIHLIAENDLENFRYVVIGAITINVFLTFLAYPFIPFFEKIFGLISDITLVEYTDINKPLLKKLSIEAPGTFQHSLQVANLAEAAAAEVGGNALLIKVGGLYHDIGKLFNPIYFIENQLPGENPHSKIGYDESAEIIIAHVTEGIKMAKKNGLPQHIIDFIKTHHGTTRVEYFYRLHTQENPPEDVDEDKFVYPGPSPFTKEQAILMMADSIEAASKSIKEPSHEKLNKLVDDIVAHQLERNQFDNAPITLLELKKCKEVFKKRLTSMYHIRVEYPEDKT